jgi:hypothetical protein
MGKLFVVSFPRGLIVVDGEATSARTPFTGFVVPAGEREVAILWGDGALSPSQRVTVTRDKTTHLYFRREPTEGSHEACERGHDEGCFGVVGKALHETDAAEIVTRAETYLEYFPEGAYAQIARTIVDSKEMILEEEARARRWIYAGAAALVAAFIALLVVLLRRARSTPGTPRGT